MIESWHDRIKVETTSTRLFQDIFGRQVADLRFANIGSTLVIMGTVPTYEVKRRIDAEAESRGLTILNCVRVMPGRNWSDSGTMQAAS